MIANRFSKKFKFKNWPNSKLPQVAEGVYVIWHDDQLIYAGMSGREIEKEMTKGRLTTAILVGLLTSRIAEIPNNSDAFSQNLTKWSRKRSR